MPANVAGPRIKLYLRSMETPQADSSPAIGASRISVTLYIFLVILTGTAAWYLWHVQHNPAPNNPAQQSYQNSGWNTTVASGKGVYSVTFPDGWHVLRDTANDSFMVGGETQPTAKLGVPAVVTDTQFGSDGPVVLFIAVDANNPQPRGSSSDFLLENGKENSIMGKKFVYEYQADAMSGIGDQRIKGDRDYVYVFAIGKGKYLQVSYSVYPTDPRNQIATIDALVRTIRIN